MQNKMEILIKEISKMKCVSAIFLFGSRAREKERKDSDVDIAVLTKNASYDKEMKIIGYGDEIFDVHVFSRLPLIIQFRILKEGKVIFCRNKKDIYDIKSRVFKSYWDFSVFINRFYWRVLRNA